MIVRNEEHNLRRCIGSVAGLVDEMIIVDTGSTDGTVALAEELGATVLHLPWRNSFSVARNHGLAAATGDWILVLDADEELAPGQGALLRSLLTTSGCEAYAIIIDNEIQDAVWARSEASATVRLWRNRPEYRFVRDLHEQIAVSIVAAPYGGRIGQSGLRVIHHGYNTTEVKRKGKETRNLPMAEKAVKTIGDDFSHFNLGVELVIHRRFAEALKELRTAERMSRPVSALRPKLAKSILLCLLELDRTKELLHVAERYAQQWPDYTDIVFLTGAAYDRLGKPAEARLRYQRCLELGPASPERYPGAAGSFGSYQAAWMLGQACEALSDNEGALAAYRRAYALDPDWPTPLFRLATIAARQMSAAELQAELEQLTAGAANQPLLVVQSLYLAKLYPAVLTYLDSPPMADFSQQTCAFLRGQTLLRLHRWLPAAEQLALLTTDSPNYLEALISRVWLAASLDRDEETGRLLRDAPPAEATFLSLSDLSLQTSLDWCLRGLVLGGDAGMLQRMATALKRELARGATN